MSMEERVFETDSYMEMADKIFNKFALLQSCTIKGLVQLGDEVFSKGELVLQELEAMDVEANTFKDPARKNNRRVRVKPENSIGGFVAQKIFKYDKQTRNGKLEVRIWRVQ